jgi:hypothetical protein
VTDLDRKSGVWRSNLGILEEIRLPASQIRLFGRLLGLVCFLCTIAKLQRGFGSGYTLRARGDRCLIESQYRFSHFTLWVRCDRDSDIDARLSIVVWEISSVYIAWRDGKQKPNIKELEKKLHFLQHLQQLAAARERQQKMAKFKSQFGFK